jgi:hypothetical protein
MMTISGGRDARAKPKANGREWFIAHIRRVSDCLRKKNGLSVVVPRQQRGKR